MKQQNFLRTEFCLYRNNCMNKLSPVAERFILHWGEMGTRWGINRTVAQVHALLYISPQPLNAEEVASALSVARSNVSNSLRDLQGWGIVRVVHVLGDRRDHFESMQDVWEMFSVIIEERKRREIDPTVELLRDVMRELEQAGPTERFTRQRVGELLGFLESVLSFYGELKRVPTGALKRIGKLRGQIRKLLAGASGKVEK